MLSSSRGGSSRVLGQPGNPFEQLKQDQDEVKLEKDLGRTRNDKAKERAAKELGAMIQQVLKQYQQALFFRENYDVTPENSYRWRLAKSPESKGWPSVVEVTLVFDDKGSPDHLAVAMGYPGPRGLCAPSQDELIATIDQLHRTKNF